PRGVPPSGGGGAAAPPASRGAAGGGGGGKASSAPAQRLGVVPRLASGVPAPTERAPCVLGGSMGQHARMRFVDVEGARLSAIGLGCWQFGSSDWGYGEDYARREAGAIVHRALDLGVN